MRWNQNSNRRVVRCSAGFPSRPLSVLDLNDFADSVSTGELHLYVDDTIAFWTGDRIGEISIFKLPHWVAMHGREEADVTKI